MKFLLQYPVFSLVSLVSGVLEVFMGAAVFYLVYRGSKNSFAYTLLAFCIWDGVTNILFFFATAYVKDLKNSESVWINSF